MEELEKMLLLARQCVDNGSVHLLGSDGVCKQCGGPCMAIDDAYAVIIINDVPCDVSFDALEISEERCDESIDEPGRNRDYSKEPWYNALTAEERKKIIRQLEAKEVQNIREEQKKKPPIKTRDLLGWG